MRIVGDDNINEQNRVVPHQDANPDARINAINMNIGAADEVALDNGQENLDGQPDDRIRIMPLAHGQMHENLPGLYWDSIAEAYWDPVARVYWEPDDDIVHHAQDAARNAAALEPDKHMYYDSHCTLSREHEYREHVPPLSKFGDQICELLFNKLIFNKANAGVWTLETLDLPDEFTGKKCRFFDAEGTLCVMVFEADGVNTVMYDFHTGQVLGGGQMPEAINWDDGDCLRKVMFSERDGFRGIITRGDNFCNIYIPL